MALERAAVPVTFGEGIDTKTDTKLVLPGKLLRLENGNFRKGGIISKRNGYEAIGDTALDNSTVGAGDALNVYRGAANLENPLREELLKFKGHTFYSYSSGLGVWIDKGSVVPVTVGKSIVAQNQHLQSLPDADTNSGVTLYAWEDSRGGIRASARDDATGSILLADTSVSTTGVRPRVVTVRQVILLFYRKAGSLLVKVFSPSALTFGSELTIATDINTTDDHFDAVLSGSTIILIYNTSAAAGLKIIYVRDDGTVGAPITGLPSPIVMRGTAKTFAPSDVDTGANTIAIAAHGFTEDTVVWASTATTLPAPLVVSTNYFVHVVNANSIQLSTTLGGVAIDLTTQGTGTHTLTPQPEVADNCAAIVAESAAGKFYLAWHSDTNGLRAAVVNAGFTFAALPFTLSAIASPIVENVTGALPTAGGSVTWFYQVYAAATYNRYVKTTSCTAAGVAGTPAVLRRGLGLASKAFLWNTLIYVGCVHDSVLQATYFVLDENGVVVAKLLQNVAGGLTTKAMLPRVIADAGEFRFPALEKTKLASDADGVYMRTGVAQLSLDFAGANRYFAGQLGANLHIVGGVVQVYDGHGTVEAGFHLFPENVSATPATSGGSMADGAYQYSVVYGWMDNAGQVHRSAPSVALTATVSGGGGSGKVTLTIPTLRLTSKTSPRAEVSIDVYRTEINGAIFYRVSSITSPTVNDPTADTVSFVDTLVDSAIIDNELLYTTGDVVDNDAPPAASLIAVGKNRIFLGGLEQGNTIRYSKEFQEGEGVGFSELFSIRVDPAGGTETALAIMDDKLIIFKRQEIFQLSGRGPLDDGTQDEFGVPESVTTDVGCAQPASIVKTPLGLMFQSSKGYYLLGRDLSVSYIGAPVDAYKSVACVSAELIEDDNQVRFLTAGTCLVYDYLARQWSTYTNHAGVDAVIWQRVYRYLRTDGVVWSETAGEYLDNGKGIKLIVGTSWLKPAALQGFQRIYRAMLLGTYRSTHTLIMRVAYDFQSYWRDEFHFDTATLLDQSIWGDDAVWAEAGTVWGGVTDNVYQFEGHPTVQKCQAVRFEFEDVVTGTPGEGFDLAGLTLLVGIKAGLNKLRDSKRA